MPGYKPSVHPYLDDLQNPKITWRIPRAELDRRSWEMARVAPESINWAEPAVVKEETKQ